MKQTTTTHYTIYGIADDYEPAPGEKMVYVPGHDIGNGWTRHMVQIAKGDTADNPSSTKGPIYGPAFIVYDVHASGIRTQLFDTPGQFYAALGEFAIERYKQGDRDPLGA